MALYRYTAVAAGGDLKTGEIEAESTQSAAHSLMRLSLTPIRVEEAGLAIDWRQWLGALSRRSGPLRAGEILDFTRQLASLLKSGLTLERALTISQQLSSTARLTAFSRDVLAGVRRGASLAEALRSTGLPLPSYYLSMIRAGEASGSLAPSLSRLVEALDQSHRTRERIVSALVYPAILLATIGLTLLLIVTFVLPRFQALFDEAGGELPLATRLVMMFGVVLRNYGWALLGVAAVSLGALQRALASGERRRQLDRLLLRSVWYRNTLAKAEAARFARTLGMLASGGVPLAAGFRIAVSTLRNEVLADAAQQALEGVNAGKDLADQLGRLGQFPPLLLQMTRVGLETGRLHETLIEAADILDDESRRAIERSVAVAVPLVTVAMGLVVAGLIGSVLVGILSINDLAG